MITLNNGAFTVTVNTHGAELVSWVAHADQREYVWQGDPAIWSGHAPLLFPIVGRQKDDLCDYGDGKLYPMCMHGFARHSDFSVTAQTEDYVRMELHDSDDTRACYPFSFCLVSEFFLRESTLTVRRTVQNRSEVPMPFLLGEHFGFCVAQEEGEAYSDYYVEFACEESCPCWPLNADHYLDRPEPYLEKQTRLWLDPHMFDGDARILRTLQSRCVTLCSKKHSRRIQLAFPDFQSLGLWAKPNAPYLCIEPWVGGDSCKDDSHSFSEKDQVITLAPGEEKTLECKITVFA